MLENLQLLGTSNYVYVMDRRITGQGKDLWLHVRKNSETPTQPSLGRLRLPVISKDAISISTGNLGCPTLKGILTNNNPEQGRCYGWTEECLSVC